MQMNATVTIESGPHEELTATVTGYESRLDGLVVDVSAGLRLVDEGTNQSLSILFEGSEDFWTLVWRLIRPARTVIGTINQILDDRVKRPLQITVTVPERTAISLRDFSGAITANGLYTTVDLEVLDDTVVSLGAITGLTLEAGSGSEVSVKYLTGDCKATLGCNSKLLVTSGAIEALDLDVDSGCKSEFQLSCQDVTYTAASNTEFQIWALLGALHAEVDFESTVDLVECRDARSVDMTVGSDCTITCRGSVADASFDLDSSTEVTLGSVTQQLNVEAGYDCKVVTTKGPGTASISIEMEDEAELHLIGAIQEGVITLGDESDVFVGQILGEVSTNFGSDTRLRTGYFVSSER